MDTLIPDVIRDSAPSTYAARSEDRQRRKMLTDKACQGRRAELGEAIDNIVRGLRVLRDVKSARPEMRQAFWEDTIPGLLDVIANIDAVIDRDADEEALYPPAPLDLSDLHALWETVK